MRLPASLLPALLLALPAGAAVVRAPSGASAEIAPVAVLAHLLATTLPALPPLVSAAPTPTPALLDASRAEALLERARALPPLVTDAPSPDPLQVIETVNSTLRDFSPAQIRDMPAEKLQALASVILDGAAGHHPKADLTAVSTLTEASLAKVERLRGKVTETLHNPGHNESHEDLITVRGVPENVNRYDERGVVFRHYTSKKHLWSILREKSLWNGLTSYVQVAPGVFKKVFPDLAGVFLTLPGVAGESVGVPARKGYDHYVDLRVPAGLPILEIEKGAIYLIPMPGRTRGWIADLYRRWVAGKGKDSLYKNAVDDVEASGGPGPELSVPIEIVGHGRIGP